MHICNSSLRAVTLAETRARAEALAPSLGITRVTDTTHLDRVGIPVSASIRPGAAQGSLCVNAGKGVLPEEAHVGALMEAIEYALAEPTAPFAPPVVRASIRDVLDGRTRPDAILDFAPLFGAAIPPDAPLDCVEAEEMLTGGRVLVPACLVFLPDNPAVPIAAVASRQHQRTGVGQHAP